MKLIDKDALVAEIERLKRELLQRKWQCRINGLEKIMHQISILNKMLSFIDTLEVKEVDLQSEIDDVFKKYKNGYNGLFICKKTDFSLTAKHFFELGLNASNSLTWEDIKLIWTIGDEIPYMPEEEFFKELLKQFKAQKGE